MNFERSDRHAVKHRSNGVTQLGLTMNGCQGDCMVQEAGR